MLLNQINFYILRILPMWKLGPCRSAWVPPPYIVYRVMPIGRKIFWLQIILADWLQIKIRRLASNQNSQIGFKSFKSFSQIATKSKFAKAIIQAFSQIATKSKFANWLQIILADCHQIKIRKGHYSGILAKRP